MNACLTYSQLQLTCVVADVVLLVSGAAVFGIGVNLSSVKPLLIEEHAWRVGSVITLATVSGGFVFLSAGIAATHWLWGRASCFCASLMSLTSSMVMDILALSLMFALRDNIPEMAAEDDEVQPPYKYMCEGYSSCRVALDYKMSLDGGAVGGLLILTTLVQILLIHLILSLGRHKGTFAPPSEFRMENSYMRSSVIPTSVHLSNGLPFAVCTPISHLPSGEEVAICTIQKPGSVKQHQTGLLVPMEKSVHFDTTEVVVINSENRESNNKTPLNEPNYLTGEDAFVLKDSNRNRVNFYGENSSSSEDDSRTDQALFQSLLLSRLDPQSSPMLKRKNSADDDEETTIYMAPVTPPPPPPPTPNF